MSVFRRMAALPLPAVLAGCLTNAPVNPCDADCGGGLGSFQLSTNRTGEASLFPQTCMSGDRQRFLGGDFVDPKNAMVVRLVVDPLSGPAVRAFASSAPYERSVVFYRQECRVFQFSLDATGWTVNNFFDYRITLDVDCSRSDESLRGSASATHCH